MKIAEQDRAPPPPLDGGGGGSGGGDLSNSHHYSADFATFDRRLDQQQQQQQLERFSNIAPVAPQPHARRHTVSGGLDLGLGMNGGGGGSSDPPPGFPASRSHSHPAIDAWGAPPALLARPGSSGGGGRGGGITATSAEVAEDGPAAGMHLGARLWESMGAGGLDCRERSSWPSALLSPDNRGGGEQTPWGS